MQLAWGLPVAQTDYPFKDIARLTRFVSWALWGFLAVEVLGVAADAASLGWLGNALHPSATQDPDVLSADDIVEAVIGFLEFAGILVSGFLVLRWIYVANRNSHAFGARDMQFTPGWAVGWYFIPIAALWKPYQAMKEIWQTSAGPSHWRETAVPALLPWWWTLWLLAGATGAMAVPLLLRADIPSSIAWASMIDIVSSAVDVPACVILIVIVNRVAQMQDRERFNSVFGPRPPDG